MAKPPIYLTPDAYAAMQRQGSGQLQGAQQSLNNTRHWTQALGDVLLGLGGQARMDMARQGETEASRAANARLAAMVAGDESALNAAIQDSRTAQAAFNYKLQAPQREAAAFKMAQAKENAPLERQLMQAKIAQAQRRASEEAAARYGKTGAIFQDQNSGQFYTVQFADDGTRKIMPLEGGMTPAGLSPRAAGDKTTAVKEAEANVAGRQGLAKSGRSMAAAEIGDENLFRSLDNVERLSSRLTTGFVGSISKHIAGTPGSDLAIELQQIRANMGFGALQQMRDNSPTGGALGHVTERELALLQNAEVALDQAQSLPAFRSALKRIREIKRKYAVERRKAWDQDVKRFGAENVPSPFLKDNVPPQETAAPQGAGGRFDFAPGMQTQGQQGSAPVRRKFNPETGRIE